MPHMQVFRSKRVGESDAQLTTLCRPPSPCPASLVLSLGVKATRSGVGCGLRCQEGTVKPRFLNDQHRGPRFCYKYPGSS